jgi:hypothetical protein
MAFQLFNSSTTPDIRFEAGLCSATPPRAGSGFDLVLHARAGFFNPTTCIG